MSLHDQPVEFPPQKNPQSEAEPVASPLREFAHEVWSGPSEPVARSQSFASILYASAVEIPRTGEDTGAAPKPLTPDQASLLIRELENRDPQVRSAAFKELQRADTQAIPLLETFMNKTTSLEAYSKAKNLFKALPQPALGEDRHILFSAPYNAKSAADLISKLGSTSPLERARAQDKLIGMGSDVWPDLIKAQNNHPDVQIRRAATEAISELAEQEGSQCLQHSYRMLKLYEQAGITMGYSTGLKATDGRTREWIPGLIAPTVGTTFFREPQATLTYERPKTPLSDADRQSFEAIIAFGDKMGDFSNGSRLAQTLKEQIAKETDRHRNELASHRSLNRPDFDRRDGLTLATLSDKSRVAYAHALSYSSDRKDQIKCLELMTKILEQSGTSSTPPQLVTDMAARLAVPFTREGREPFERFKEAYKKAGGDPKEIYIKQAGPDGKDKRD